MKMNKKEYKELILKVIYVLLCLIGVLIEICMNFDLERRIKVIEGQEIDFKSKLASADLRLRVSDLLGLDRATIETILGAPFSSSINIDHGGLDACYMTNQFFEAEGIVRISYSDLYGNIDESNVHSASWNFVMPEAYFDQKLLYSDILSQIIEWYGKPDEAEEADDTEIQGWYIWYGNGYNEHETNESMLGQGIVRAALEYFPDAFENDLESDGYEGYTYITFSFSDYIGN